MSKIPYCLRRHPVDLCKIYGWGYPYISPQSCEYFHSKGIPVISREFSRVSVGAHVYFLFFKGECVYVGQSVSLLRRIADHQRTGKVFDSFSYITVKNARDLNRVEQYYIWAEWPFYNAGCVKQHSVLYGYDYDRYVEEMSSLQPNLFTPEYKEIN